MMLSLASARGSIASCSRENDTLLAMLIAEHELMIADMIEETLVENGYGIRGIARSVDETVALR